MKKYSLAEAAKILGHRGGAYGLGLDLKYADDMPAKLAEQQDNGKWRFHINDMTLPMLKAYYESKKAG